MKKLNKLMSVVLAVCVVLSSMPMEVFAAFQHKARTYSINSNVYSYYISETEHYNVCDGCYAIFNRTAHTDNDTDGHCDTCYAEITNGVHTHNVTQAGYIHMDPYGHMEQCSGCVAKFTTHTNMTGVDKNQDGSWDCDYCGWDGMIIGGGGGGPTCPHNNTFFTVDEESHVEECADCGSSHKDFPHSDDNGDYFCDVCNATVSLNQGNGLFMHHHSGSNFTQKDQDHHFATCTSCGRIYNEAHVDNHDNTNTSVATPDGYCDACGEHKCVHPNIGGYEIGLEGHKPICADCGTVIIPPQQRPQPHTDSDGNSVCDDCSATLDANNQHVHQHDGNKVPFDGMQHVSGCTGCPAKFYETHADDPNNPDGICDICGYGTPLGCQHLNHWFKIDTDRHEKVCMNCTQQFTPESHTDSDTNGRCDGCDAGVAYNNANGIFEHTHTFAASWDKDDSYHFHECTDTVCTSAKDREQHDDSPNVDGYCDKCGQCVAHVQKVTNGKPDYFVGPAGHEKICGICGNRYDGQLHVDGDNDSQCDDCGFAITCNHQTAGRWWDTNETDHTLHCDCGYPVAPAVQHKDYLLNNGGTQGSDGLCDECNVGVVMTNGQLTHTHVWSTQPSANNYNTEHFYDCTDPECTKSTNPHPAQDADNDGVCDICNYGSSSGGQSCSHTAINYTADVTVHGMTCINCGTNLGTAPHININPADNKCDDCDATVDSNNEHTHVPGLWVPNVSTNDHESQCTDCGSFVHDPHNDTNPADGTCDICGGILNGQGGGNPPQGCSHNNGTWLRADQTLHRQVCADCGIDLGTAPHIDNDNDSHCDDCFGKLDFIGGQLVHNHTPHPNGWYADEENHFYRCDTCGMTEFGHDKHINLDGDTACDICNVTVDSAERHNCVAIGQLSWQAEDEHVHYQRCNECNGRVTDENHSDAGTDDKCDKCNATLDANDVHIHQPVGNWSPVDHTDHAGDCSECETWLIDTHNDNGNGICADCGYIINCQHPLGNQWMSTGEETHQLHCGDCGDALDNEYPHENDGNGKCKDCGIAVDNQNIHKHNWSTAWSAENTGHSHNCTDAKCTSSTMAFVHVDADNDNACDDCGDTNIQNWCAGHNHNGSHYVQENRKHYKVCENCQSIMDKGSDCTDTDMDEACDVCDMSFEHNVSEFMIEYNGGHAMYCLDCGKVIPISYGPHQPASDGTCISVDNAHHADYCHECGLGITASKMPHKDTDSDSFCDDCGVSVDASGIHTHNKVVTVIYQKVHIERCDECGVVISQTLHADTDGNGKCDGCTASLNADKQHIHKEKATFSNNMTHAVHCEDCSQLLYGADHTDANGDSVCDICLGTIENVNVVIDSAQLSSITASIKAAIEKAFNSGDLTDMKKFFTAPDSELEDFAEEYKENVVENNDAGFYVNHMKVTVPLSEALNDPDTMVYFDRAAAAVQDSKADSIFIMDILTYILYHDGREHGMSADNLIGTALDYTLTIDAEDVASNRTWYIVASYDEGETFTKIAESSKGGNTVSFTADNFYGYFAVCYVDEVAQPTPTPTPAPTPTPSAPSATPAPTATPAPSATPTPSAQPTATPEPEAEMPENADTSVAGDTATEEVIQAVKDNATVSDGVVQLDKEAMDAVVDATEADETVVIPVKDAAEGKVNETLLNKDVLSAVAENGQDVVIEFTDATLKLDAKALQAVTDTAEGENIEIRIVKADTEKLTDSQKKAIKDMDSSIVISAEIYSDGEYIGKFKGGKATVMFEFTPEEGKDPKDYRVYYIGEDGSLKKVAADYVDGYMVFTTTHFSDYVVIYEGKVMGDAPVTQPEKPAQSSMFAIPLIAAVFVAIVVLITILKKKKAE